MIDNSGNMLYHINNLNTQSERISYQMATGKVIDQGSDDAMLHSEVINLENKLRVTEGLKLQIEKTRALNDTADQNIGDVKLALDSIKIDLLKSLNDGMDRSDKLALATNLEGIRENIIDRVNTDIDGEYIFSGSVTTNQTMVKDENYKLNGKIEFNGDGFLREIAVQPGSYRDRGVTAYDVSFYTSNSANASEAFTFSDGERIIDENGNEWKLNENGNKLQKYDHNGIIEDPIEEIKVNIPYSKEVIVDLGIGTNADANGTYVINITDLDGVEYEYMYTADGTKSAADVHTELQTQIELDFPGVTGGLTEDDKFTLTHIDGLIVRVDDMDSQYNISATNEIESIGSDTGTAVKGTYSMTLPSSPEGRLFEAKHNYLEDLNVIINALSGYGTKLDGTKSAKIDDPEVQEILRVGLGQTTNQFNASNIGHGELGGRNNVFEVAYDKILTQETHYNILIQETNGADMAKLAMESKSLEMTYQALYSTIAKMNELSLMNYLK